MNKKIFYIASVLILSLLSGCSDNKTKDSNPDISKEASASGIEVVKNDNSLEIKVKEKDHSDVDKQYYFGYGVKSAYAQNSRPANKDASVREKPRTAVDANLHIRSPYEKVQISLLKNTLSKKFIVKCSACHNNYANGIIGPSLLNKKPALIIEKINKFKNDKSANILMYDLVNMMSDDEIKEMAEEIYRFNLEIQKIRNK